jgi:hypothetical protein
VSDKLQAMTQLGPDLVVEMDFPDTRNWTKQQPLDKILVHFAQDHEDSPVLGFGVPGVGVFDDSDPANPTAGIHEAAQHILNFDVGVWVSAEMGGATKRLEVVQALKNLLATQGGKIAFNEATDGLNIVSFDGGRNALDRIADVPVWRALDMTLIVRVFSRHIPASAVATGYPIPLDPVPLDITIEENLTIRSEDGTDEPVTTP